MFIIIGGDGNEYGPASAEQIRGWIAAGRANLDTRAKVAGTDEWRRLADFAEFFPAANTPPVIDAERSHTLLAERWRRFFGALIDGTLEMACWMPTSVAIMRSVGDMAADGAVDPEHVMEIFWSSLGLSLPYLLALFVVQVVLLNWRSQSIGNILLRTRIVRVSDDQPGGFLRAFLLRGFLARIFRQVPVFGFFFWLTDSLFIFRDDKRCLHDLIAGTKVIKV